MPLSVCVCVCVCAAQLYAVDWRQFREWPTVPLPFFLAQYSDYALLKCALSPPSLKCYT